MIGDGGGGRRAAALGTGSFNKDGEQRGGGGAPGPSSLSLLEPVMGWGWGATHFYIRLCRRILQEFHNGAGVGGSSLLQKTIKKGLAGLHNAQQDLRIGFRKMLCVIKGQEPCSRVYVTTQGLLCHYHRTLDKAKPRLQRVPGQRKGTQNKMSSDGPRK